MNTEWWNDESPVEAFLAHASSVRTAALLPGVDSCWVVCNASYDPPGCTWTQTISRPERVQAIALLQAGSLRLAAWQHVLQSPSAADWLVCRKGAGDGVKEGEQSKCVVVERAVALALCALSFPAVRKRNQRQGITAIHAGTNRLTAFLFFQSRLFGLFEHDSAVPVNQFLEDLKEFRLGWLPDEVVRAQGGYGAALSTDMPPQAEGFVPTFVFGPRKSLLAMYGKLLDPPMDSGCAECRGLLYGLAIRETSSCRHL